MKTNAGIAAAILTHFAFFAIGHEDPLGDHDPNLKCTETGYRLVFNRSVPGKAHDATIERVYDESLKVLEERQLSEEEIFDDTQRSRRWEILFDGTWYFLEAASQQRPTVRAYRPNGNIEILRPEWPTNVGYTTGFSVTGDAIVIACNEFGAEDGDPFGLPPEDEGDLLMVAFSLKDLSHIGTLRLGRPSRIYSVPVSSELVSSDSKFYFGWVRHNPDGGGEWMFELVVSEWDVRNSKHKNHVVDEDTTWNGGLSIDACSNQIVVAYHDQPAPFEKASIHIRKLQLQQSDDQAGAR